MTTLQTHPRLSEGERGRVAAKLFLGITSEWGLTDTQRQILAGAGSRTTIDTWKKRVLNNEPLNLHKDTIERLSYIAGIYKGLQILLPTREQWAAWVKKPNREFGGQSALERMLGGRVMDLAYVRHYLDAQRGW
jgi:hypothetical protein